jgi:ribonuclease P protein component
MLKKNQRLAKVTRQKGARVFTSPFLTISYFENNQETSRFAFIISKKVDKRAVVRNRLKRKVSKYLEDNLLKIKPGFDIIIILKPSILTSEENLNQVLEEVISKTDLLK